MKDSILIINGTNFPASALKAVQKVAVSLGLAVKSSAVSATTAVARNRSTVILLCQKRLNEKSLQRALQDLNHGKKGNVILLVGAFDKKAIPRILQTGISSIVPVEKIEEELPGAIKAVIGWRAIAAGRDRADEQLEPRPNAEILRTRFYKPRLEPSFVKRPVLIERLESFSNKPLILVSAAPGFGKSIAVSQWLDSSRRRHCWLSMDEDMNDVVSFLRYAVAAINSAFPGAMTGLKKSLQSRESLPVLTLAHQLINDLDEIEAHFTLVLDDFHRIHHGDIYAVIAELLRYPVGHMNLCIITRRDPPIQLDALHVHNRMGQIRMADLAFSVSEILQVSANLLDKPLSEEQARALLASTEGWIGGIILGLLAIRKSENADAILKDVSGSLQNTADYLIHRVLNHLQEPERETILKVSLLDRFCAGLIDSVCIETSGASQQKELHGEAIIRSMQHSNLFLIPLDEQDHWFRFHHFFQTMLQTRAKSVIPAAAIQRQQERAVHWFMQQDLFEDALEQALLSGKSDLPGQVILSFRHKLFNREEFWRLRIAMERLPAKMIEQDLTLQVTELILLESSVNYDRMLQKLDRLEKSVKKTDFTNEITLGEFQAMRAIKSYFSKKYPLALKCAEQAQKLLPAHLTNTRTLAIGFKAFSLQVLRGEKDSLSFISSELRTLSPREEYARLRLEIIRLVCYSLTGKVDSILSSGREALELARKSDKPESLSIAMHNLARAYYLMGKFDSAIEVLEASHQYRYVSRRPWYLFGLGILAKSHLAKNDMESMSKVIRSMNEFMKEVAILNYQGVIKAFEVDLALQIGRHDVARRLHQDAVYDLDWPRFVFYSPRLTRLKFLFALGDDVEKAAAAAELDDLLLDAKKIHNTSLYCQALIIKANQLYRSSPEQRSTQVVLREAIELLRSCGNVRSIVDHGDALAPAIAKLSEKNPADGFLSDLLKQFNRQGQVQTGTARIGWDMGMQDNLAKYVASELTDRQREILVMVAGGSTNQEIADRLRLSVNSIKKYLSDCFQVLDVKNRMSAIVKVREMGLLQ